MRSSGNCHTARTAAAAAEVAAAAAGLRTQWPTWPHGTKWRVPNAAYRAGAVGLGAGHAAVSAGAGRAALGACGQAGRIAVGLLFGFLVGFLVGFPFGRTQLWLGRSTVGLPSHQ